MARKRRKKNSDFKKIFSIILSMIFIITIYYIDYLEDSDNNINDNSLIEINYSYDLESIPEYIDSPYVIINNNIPSFDGKDYNSSGFEKYSKLDVLGRCGVAYANICKEIMPPKGDERGDISSVKPTGWKQKKYNGEYLYNRCHLIGYQLSDEDANKQNLITGTRYFNVEGMLPFEDMVADYIRETKNHVLYRITPKYKDNNLVASGVQMEAKSVEDKGKGICYNVYVYNVQPGIVINYVDGSSSLR